MDTINGQKRIEVSSSQRPGKRAKTTYLEQSANQAFKWTLGALLGEWRLPILEQLYFMAEGTYSLRSLDMLDQHYQFLLANETLEARVVFVSGIRGEYRRLRTLPVNVLGLWKQVLHECLLAGQLDFDMALAKTTTSTTRPICLKAIDRSYSLVEFDEFNGAIKSLAGDTLHDNMNRLIILLIDNAGVTTKEG